MAANGPTFLMTRNFFVLKNYNNADKYALGVGLLADQIAGSSGLRQDWNRPFTPITMKEREELQHHLRELGYYDGKVDGQDRHGLAGCHPGVPEADGTGSRWSSEQGSADRHPEEIVHG